MNGERVSSALSLVGGALVACLVLLTGWLYWSGVAEFRFFSDDAFISYRYSENFTRGWGLAWNPGQIVEGYTSFLWIWVGVVLLELGLPIDTGSTAITIGAGALILVLLAGFSARLRRWTSPLVLLAPLLLATNRTFLAWCSGGLATQLFSLLCLVSALVFLREHKKRAALPVASALCFALTTLTRPEGILFAAVTGAVFLVGVLRRERTWRALALWCAVYFAVVAVHVMWRHSYYGFWLPNTYFAKVSGRSRWLEGIFYLRVFLAEYGLTWFLPLLLVPVTLRRRAEDFLFLGFVLVVSAYVLWVGGDWMEFRFMNVLLPYLYWLCIEGIGLLFALVGRPEPIARLLRARAGLHQVAPISWVPVISYMLKALGGVWVLLLVSTTYLTSARSDDEVKAAVGQRGGAISDIRRQMRPYAAARAEQGKKLRDWVERGLLPADLRIAVGGSGALPYYSGLFTIDILGWNDVNVAHGPITNPGRIGHEREASPEYLEERGVEVIDASNGLVRAGDPAALPRTAAKSYFTGDLVAIEVEPNWYLVFGTTLGDEELAELFAGLRRVF